MNSGVLIAESGGTKTDWSLLSDGICVQQSTTASFHPRLLTSQWIESQRNQLLKLFDVELGKVELHFYGAGCFDPHRAEEMKRALQLMGFNKVYVYSDVYAAGQATWGDSPGWVAILGTGSVLAYWNGQQVEGLLGGYGYLLGDEGSGYYFGKLCVRKLLDGQLDELGDQFMKHLGMPDSRMLIRMCYGDDGKSFIANLAKESVGFKDSKGIQQIHGENLRLFFSRYVHAEIKALSVVGSYAHAQEHLVRTIGDESGVEIQKVVARPIDELSKYWLKRRF